MVGATHGFNIVIVGQRGRLMYEALLFAASLRAADPGFSGRLLVAEPAPGPLWTRNPSIGDPDIRAELERLGAEILPFEAKVFGQSYPNGNKAEALAAMPEGAPFLFFDTDTIALGPLSGLSLDFNRPTASMLRENTWPSVELYGPRLSEVWRSLYDRFEMDFETSQDPAYPED